MKVLVACEYSGTVRDAFIRAGHDAISCDLLPTEAPGPHFQGNVFDILYSGFDMLIGHPPCQYIAFSGMAYWNRPGRIAKRLEALEFFRRLWEAPIEFICLENPRSIASPIITTYSQEIQPYYFGDPAYKTTWLWLKNLPPLKYNLHPSLFDAHIAVEPPEPIYIRADGKAIHHTEAVAAGKDRAKERARFWPGIAKAMADQWSNVNVRS